MKENFNDLRDPSEGFPGKIREALEAHYILRSFLRNIPFNSPLNRLTIPEVFAVVFMSSQKNPIGYFSDKLDIPNLSYPFKSLEKKGVIEKHEEENGDKRLTLVSLTKKGEKLRNIILEEFKD